MIRSINYYLSCDWEKPLIEASMSNGIQEPLNEVPLQYKIVSTELACLE